MITLRVVYIRFKPWWLLDFVSRLHGDNLTFVIAFVGRDT